MKNENILTIITVCYNAESFIRETIESVLEQNTTEFEYLIVDGGSSDHTLEIVNSFKADFKDKSIRFRIVSEPDAGIYDAMNKGLKHAMGIWVNFLNAGDVYYSVDTIKNTEEYLMDSDADVVCGKYEKVSDYFNEVVELPDLDFLRIQMIFCHQALFIRRKTHLEYCYDLNYKIVSDYNTFLKMYLDGKKFEYIPKLVVRYDLFGVSATSTLRTFKEICEVRYANGVIDNKLKSKLHIWYGMFRRWNIDHIPSWLRWLIVRWKRRMNLKESLY